MQKAFIKDLTTYLPSKLLPALTGFISAPILTRLFLPAEYGYIALAVGIAELLRSLSVSGFGASAIRFFPTFKTKGESSAFFSALGTSTGVVLAATSIASLFVILVLRGQIAGLLYTLLILSIALYLVRSLYGVLMQVVRAQERSSLYTILELITHYGALGLGLLLVIAFGMHVEGILWGEVLVLAVVLPVLLRLTIKGADLSVRNIRSRDALQMWQYAWPLAIGNAAMWGLRLSDRYIIAFNRPDSEVGLYSASYNLSSKSIDMLVAVFLLSMGPIVINTWERQGREATEKSLRMITRLFIILTFPAAAGLSVLAFPFVDLLTADAYQEGYRIVGFVAFSSFVWGLSQIASMGILINKTTRRIAVNLCIAALINIGLNMILIPRFGFVAAGITTLIGYSVLLILQAYTSHIYLTWRFPLRTLRNVVIATVFMWLTAASIYSIFGDKGSGVHIVGLLLSILAAVAVYFISIFFLGEASRKEMKAMRQFLSRLPIKAA